MSGMVCPECGSSDALYADGRLISEYDLLHLPRAAKKIERVMSHALWCPSIDNRMRIEQWERKQRAAHLEPRSES